MEIFEFIKKRSNDPAVMRDNIIRSMSRWSTEKIKAVSRFEQIIPDDYRSPNQLPAVIKRKARIGNNLSDDDDDLDELFQ